MRCLARTARWSHDQRVGDEPRVTSTRPSAPSKSAMLHIGVLQFTIEIAYANSLKDKRSVLTSLREKLRRTYNISIAEIEDQDEWTTATLGITAAGSDIAQINSLLDRIVNVLEEFRNASLLDHQIEIISPQ